MVEIEPMRDSSESEEDDAHESQDERRRGYTRLRISTFILLFFSHRRRV